jgi:hypothetical protein
MHVSTDTGAPHGGPSEHLTHERVESAHLTRRLAHRQAASPPAAPRAAASAAGAAPLPAAAPVPDARALKPLDLELLANSLVERYFETISAAMDAKENATAEAAALARIRSLMDPAYQIMRADGSRDTKARRRSRPRSQGARHAEHMCMHASVHASAHARGQQIAGGGA